MLEINDLENPRTALRPFVAPHLRLLVKHLPKTAVALVATVDGVRAGFALALVDRSGKSGTIHALEVVEAFRNFGIGSRLLMEVERRLREAGCDSCRVEQYEDIRERTESVEFAKNREYRMESTLLRQFVLSTEAMVAQRWVVENCRLPDGAELFPWAQLSAEERNELKIRSDLYPPGMSPFLFEDRIDLEFSVGMRIGGKVAGWLIMEKLAPDMMLYRTMYVVPEFERLGIGFVMATEATRVPGFVSRYPYIRFNIFESNRPMVRLIEKRYAEATVRAKRLILLSKAL
jgi:GNAT superfamily N-acetyltransferase